VPPVCDDAVFGAAVCVEDMDGISKNESEVESVETEEGVSVELGVERPEGAEDEAVGAVVVGIGAGSEPATEV
jgi:hypothetical protein